MLVVFLKFIDTVASKGLPYVIVSLWSLNFRWERRLSGVKVAGADSPSAAHQLIYIYGWNIAVCTDRYSLNKQLLAYQFICCSCIVCSESVATRLLQDQLGGNCRTRVLMCFSPFTDPSAASELFQLADNLSRVKNFPLLNEAFAQVFRSQSLIDSDELSHSRDCISYCNT